MNIKVLSIVFFITFSFIAEISAQSKIMIIHKKDGNTIQYNVADIDSVTFKDPVFYTPTFKQTNVTTGRWDGFTKYGNRLFATNTEFGIVEYKNGNWESLALPEAVMSYPTMRSNGEHLFITCPLGIYMQSGNDVYHWASWYVTQDYAGALGGTQTNFFAGAGTNGKGIFRWNNGEFFPLTNQTDGCWYSIEALDDNNIFFGAGATHVSAANYGIQRWDNTQGLVVTTNITDGVYNLVKYNNKMYAQGNGFIYVWNGSAFDKIQSGEKLRVAGDVLYCFADEGILKYDSGKNSFDVFLSKNEGSFREIEEYQDYIYVFGAKVMAFNKESKKWITVNCDNIDINLAAATQYGLFISNSNQYNGIQQMVPIY